MNHSTSPTCKKVLATVVAVSALAVAGAPFLLLDGPGANGGSAEPPWSFPAVAAQSSEGVPWSSAADITRPAAVMYIDEACIHCKAELRTWESLDQEADGAELWIVASPSSDVRQAAWAPKSLRSNVVSDADGSVARALNVQAVPVTYWIDATDTVRFVHVGRTPRQRIAEYMRSLVATPTNAGGSSQ